MSVPPEQFPPVTGRVDAALLSTRFAVVIGIGAVGSQIAEELANNHIGNLRLIDYDILEQHNLHRHALTSDYVGQNKAEGMAQFLTREVPALQVDALPWRIDEELSDEVLDDILKDAQLVVVATDDRVAQRRVGLRALALDIPAVFPGLYLRAGGEVFVQLSSEFPCFFCRDHFRLVDEALRGVAAANADILMIIQLGSQLCLAILDGSSDYQRLLAPRRGASQPPQLFIQNGLVLARHTVPWLRNCPSCAVGPSPLRPDAVEAWEAAEGRRHGRGRPTQSVITVRPEPVAQPLTPEELRRRIWFIAVGAAVLILAVIIITAESGSSSSHHSGIQPSVEQTASSSANTPAEQEAKYQKMAEARIAQLSFKCLDGDACHADPEGHSLPVFINGMDENLREYLEQHGYRDKWTDSAEGIDGQTIGPGRFVGQSPTVAYVAKAPKEGMPKDEVDTGAEFGSGLLYEERGAHENATETGVIPWDVHGGEQWTIIWTLAGPSGQVVKQLEYSVNIVECSKAISYCEEARDYDPEEPANKGDYTPPPAFP